MQTDKKNNNSGCFFTIALAAIGIFFFLGIGETLGGKGVKYGSGESDLMIFLFFAAIVSFIIYKALK